MASTHPQDYGAVLVPPQIGAQVQRVHQNLGAFVVNVTTTVQGMIFDRAAVIREIWFAAEAVPSDPDGTMLINVHVRDKSEAAFDSIVASFDTEASLTVAGDAVKATLVAETSENEYTVEAGDSLRIQLVNNSAAIATNISPVMTVLYQVQSSVD